MGRRGGRTRVVGDWSSEVFFFSSRRRHTRLVRDWSSDVCSSDLAARADRVLFLGDGRIVDEMVDPDADAIFDRVRELGG